MFFFRLRYLLFLSSLLHFRIPNFIMIAKSYWVTEWPTSILSLLSAGAGTSIGWIPLKRSKLICFQPYFFSILPNSSIAAEFPRPKGIQNSSPGPLRLILVSSIDLPILFLIINLLLSFNVLLEVLAKKVSVVFVPHWVDQMHQILIIPEPPFLDLSEDLL